jgi:hypothetical protein
MVVDEHMLLLMLHTSFLNFTRYFVEVVQIKQYTLEYEKYAMFNAPTSRRGTSPRFIGSLSMPLGLGLSMTDPYSIIFSYPYRD